jgi:spore maturation protein B
MNVSNLIIPLLVLFIIVYGIIKKVNVYDEFLSGATESFDMILKIFPSFLAMILGINIFIKSGVLNFLYQIIQPLFDFIRTPIQVFPMMIMRPISGTSTLAILNNLFVQYGPDSLIGRLASIIQGSTDTTFYVITLYFGSIGIKKIRYSLFAGLCADIIGIIASIIIVNLLFY